ncbi:MAG: GNAT family N-acetyltransferase [Gemmataceae bacterium]|nr:GNAT family N-acetyltransferase [Gemmataceae bacterium]
MNISSMNDVLTERLRLTRITPDDIPDLFRLHRDPRVMAMLGGMRSDEELQGWHERLLAHWERHGFGRWTARDRASGAFVGRGGLVVMDVDGREETEVGYALAPEFWGRGLATEIAAASLRAGFETLGQSELVCLTLPTNAASRRVMEKVGFRDARDITHADLPHVLYRLTAAEWRSSRAN